MIYYIHFIISLFAAFVVGIVCICLKEEFMSSIIHILIALFCFFIIGTIVRKVLIDMINKQSRNDKNLDNVNNETSSDNAN